VINLGSGRDILQYSADQSDGNGPLFGAGNDIVNNFIVGQDRLTFSVQQEYREVNGTTIIGTGDDTITVDATGLTWISFDGFWWNLG
jgi:hypothetical protein